MHFLVKYKYVPAFYVTQFLLNLLQIIINYNFLYKDNIELNNILLKN